MKTYHEMAQEVSALSDSLYMLAADLEKYYHDNMEPAERPMRICNIAKETLRNMSYTLETLADEMLGN